MKTKPRSTIAVLLLGAFLLAWAGTANAARDIVVENVTVTVASLNTPPLTADDTITIKNGGTLWVDQDATIKDLIIGDGTSKGTVLFSATPSALTVVNDVVFGAMSDNVLDMAYITPFTAHTLRVGRNFLRTGNGSFNAGSATIDYNGTATQNVTAKIGLGGATIQYKDVILRGNPAEGNAVKVFDPGVSINGLLDIREKAKAQGSSAVYFGLARLQYSNGGAVTASTAEWPANMTAQVTIANSTAVTLDADRTLGPGGSYVNILVIGTGSALYDAGKTVTVQGNIENNGKIEGAGVLRLAGSAAQTLTGGGVYGNVILNNANGATLPTTVPPLTIFGRLTIQNGKLTLPASTSHHASLLTFGGADKAAGNYGASTDPGAFAGTGTLIVNAKPTPALLPTGTPPEVIYGATGVTIAGQVVPPAGPPNFATFGNGAKAGETVTVTIASTPPVTQTVTVQADGTFSASFNTAGMSVGTQLGVYFQYPGGDNLAAVPLNAGYPTTGNDTTLTVVKRPITIIPFNVTKVYGAADPAFGPGSYTYTPNDALVPGDYFVGTLSRISGENVGAYEIIRGSLPSSLTITNDNNPNAAANYTIGTLSSPDNNWFDNSKRLTILQKPVTVTINPATKIYGEPNPTFTATYAPALIGTDTPSGALATTATQTSGVGSYPITKGTYTAGNNYAETFVNGTLVITRKDITVDFHDKTKVYGQPNPTYTYTITATSGPSDPDLVGSDSFTGSPSRASGETVAGSPYTINSGNLSLGNKAGNYNVTYTSTGKQTITQRDVALQASSPSKTYGNNNPDLVTYEKKSSTATTGLVNNGNLKQDYPATQPTITWGAQGTAVQCSLPGTYGYTVDGNAGDPNYRFGPPNPAGGTLTVGKRDLVIRPDNKTKVADGNLFDYGAFTVGAPAFVCGDTVANSLTGFLIYGGPAVTAVEPGVYPIVPSGWSSPTKYNIVPQNGYLSITTNPRTDEATTATWAAGGSRAWMINHPNGTAGANPGWSLLKLTGGLDMTGLTTANSFRLDLVTMIGNAAGRMPKFDPTRPYSWKFVEAGSIQVAGTFNPAVFQINYSGANLFANPVWGGTFSVRMGGDSKSLYLDFTPVGAVRDAVTGIVSTAPWSGTGSVPTSYDVAPLLSDVSSSDLDVLYLQPNATTIANNGSQDLVVELKVANLKQQIVGVNAFVNFSSEQWTVKEIKEGGGVWTQLIYNQYNVGGDMDVVIGLGLGTSTGTDQPGTVAKITLTPTRTMTSNSRVIFRADGTATVAEGQGGTGVLTYLEPAVAGAPILPARVMTPKIDITNDGTGPVLNKDNMTAVQNQPHGAANTDVKNGSATAKQVVRTAGSGVLASGPVVITVPASDAGVGLKGQPVVTVYQGSTSIVVPNRTPNSMASPFIYDWVVPADLANGEWKVKVEAWDNKNTKTTVDSAFSLYVNTREVSGLVELEAFRGTIRRVTFKVGDQNSSSSSSVKTWNHDLNFTSGYLMPAGAFQNLSGMATKIRETPDSLSTYLAYGDILNLAALRDSLLNKQNGVSTWINGLLYGKIDMGFPLLSLSGKLTTPNRSVDAYVVAHLSSDTVLKLAAYAAASNQNKPALAPALITALLNDFNTIVLGPSIFDPVRFASVNLGGDTQTALGGSDTVAINRLLLRDAYPEYQPGKLNPATAQKLTQNDPALLGALVQAFDTMAIDSAMWPSATSPFGQCLYNEQVFLGVTLSSATTQLLMENPFPVGTRLTLLNQHLLEDAYPNVFVRAPLSPATVDAARNYSAQAFEAGMLADLNALIGSGTSIYTAARFASFGPIDPGSELGQILGSGTVRENRLLLELGYDSELSKGVLAAYRLVQVPSSTSEVTAKTAWNLRVRIGDLSFSPTLDVTANFIGNGVPGWASGDRYLRGGDLTGDNAVTTTDYNILRPLFGQTTGVSAADINGDGACNILDYTLITKSANWNKTGDIDAR